MSLLMKVNTWRSQAAQDGIPTKFVGICYNGRNFYVTATSVEQAKTELKKKAEKEGCTIQSVRVAEDSAEDDVRSSVASMANIARMKSGAKVSYKITNGSMHIAEIELEFSTPEEAKNYNYYNLFNEWQSSRKSILPKWAWGFGGYSVNVSGSKMKIHIAQFST